MYTAGAWWILPLAALGAAVLSLATIPLARMLGLVDHPGGRKVHEAPTPLTGGFAVFLTFVAVSSITLQASHFVAALLAGMLLLFLTGIADDRWTVPASVRFLLQVIACAVVMAWAGVRLEDLGGLFTSSMLTLGIFSAPVTIFAALGVINSYNMIDGMDGVAGSLFLCAAAGMALFAGLSGQVAMVWLLAVASAAVLGFLALNARFPWNRRARVFLGDAGSLPLGFLLAWCFIWLGNDRPFVAERAMLPMTAVWLIAVPLLDTTTQIWRRKRAGLSPFGADQRHLHHAFLRAGFSVTQAWLGITALAVAMGVVGVALDLLGAPNHLSFWLFIACAYAYYFTLRNCWDRQRFLGRNFIYNDFDEPEP